MIPRILPRTRPRRLILLCGVVPTIVVAVLSLYRPSMFSSFESGVYDRLVRTLPTRMASDRIVILDVDERSLASVGQWPWRRDVIGKLVERLREWGAAVVALDIVFAEPDRFEIKGVTPDAALAQSLHGGRVILGYAMTFDGAHHASRTCVRHPIGLAIVQPPDVQSSEPFFHATGAVCNLENLSDAAGTSGFLNAAPDPDGILRRVPMLVEYDGNVYPLALAGRGDYGHERTGVGDPRRQRQQRGPHHQCSARRARSDDRPRRQKQSAAALSRPEAFVPVLLRR
jgi:adenylate cyclase